MPREAPALMRRHLRRRCVQCGLSADAIPASQPMECPRCGCDLAERPPRSYAQMEGLDADAPARDTERELAEARVHATAIQTVGSKGYDGFVLARVLGSRGVSA